MTTYVVGDTLIDEYEVIMSCFSFLITHPLCLNWGWVLASLMKSSCCSFSGVSLKMAAGLSYSVVALQTSDSQHWRSSLCLMLTKTINEVSWALISWIIQTFSRVLCSLYLYFWSWVFSLTVVGLLVPLFGPEEDISTDYDEICYY